MKTTRTVSALALGLLAACSVDPTDVDETGEEDLAAIVAPTPVATDACDDDAHPGATWLSAGSAHFTAYYIAGTEAERDISAILAARETAYANIRAALGVTAEPVFTLYLSPSRMAASANNKAAGKAWPGQDRYEVLYTGAGDSYEVTRQGYLIANLLEYHIDSARHASLLSVGMAEYLDQSGRDLHDAYAQQLHAGLETRVRLSSFDSADVTGKNSGRAGSLVKYLIDSYGMAAFVDVLKGTVVTTTVNCAQKSATYGCISSPAQLDRLLDGVLLAVTGDDWATVRAGWDAEVKGHLATANIRLGSADRLAIRNLFLVQDQAIAGSDAAAYRSTMEGFYCDWLGEAGRAEIAARVIDSYVGTTTAVQAIYPTSTVNFTTARVLVKRTDERGVISLQNYTVEKFPAGWRITYGADWW